MASMIQYEKINKEFANIKMLQWRVVSEQPFCARVCTELEKFETSMHQWVTLCVNRFVFLRVLALFSSGPHALNTCATAVLDTVATGHKGSLRVAHAPQESWELHRRRLHPILDFKADGIHDVLLQAFRIQKRRCHFGGNIMPLCALLPK